MSESGIQPKAFFELFAFLDQETPAAKKWINNYLRRNGIAEKVPVASAQGVQLDLAMILTRSGLLSREVEVLSEKMNNAWRARKSRADKNVASLSVRIDKTVADQLTQMSRGKTKAEVVTMLIQQNYVEFLEAENRRKNAVDEEKRLLKLAKINSTAQKPSRTSPTNFLFSIKLSKIVNEIREKITSMSEMLESISKRDQQTEDPQRIQETLAKLVSEQMLKVQEAILADLSIRERSSMLKHSPDMETQQIYEKSAEQSLQNEPSDRELISIGNDLCTALTVSKPEQSAAKDVPDTAEISSMDDLTDRDSNYNNYSDEISVVAFEQPANNETAPLLNSLRSDSSFANQSNGFKRPDQYTQNEVTNSPDTRNRPAWLDENGKYSPVSSGRYKQKKPTDKS